MCDTHKTFLVLQNYNIFFDAFSLLKSLTLITLPNSARVHTSNFYPCVCVRCVCFWWYLIFHPFLVSLPPPSLSARRVPCRIALDIFYPNLPMALFFATALYVANKALSNIPMTVNTPPTIAHMDVTK